MVKKRGLGKSLDALLAYKDTNTEELNNIESIHSVKDKLVQLDVDKLQRGKYQPRQEMDQTALEELASSIQSQGIIQPLVVRSTENGKYEIIAGERRWRAAKLAGLKTVPSIVRQIPDEAAVAVALIENIQRENLNPIEEAIAMKRLIDEFKLTQQQLSESLGKSRASVSNLLRLLTLPQAIRQLLEQGKLEMGHARTLITLPEELQLEAAELIVSKQLSVRETESMVRHMQEGSPIANKKPLDPNIRQLQDSLARQLHMKVAIQCNQKGRGKLTIHYRNLDELDELMHKFEIEATSN